MQSNPPVVHREKHVKENTNILSTTDAGGVIRHINQDLIDISGFTSEELVGQTHDILPHPDMPEQVFKILWNTTKNHHPWKGIVKNRCKDGGYYWVDAYVTPILK
ncbi:MAG: PAS domain-containing protein, partial [Robiginitomaculum sp.]|nr:PAS domain-containing protein [Robiginitomaculum sp.]